MEASPLEKVLTGLQLLVHNRFSRDFTGGGKGMSDATKSRYEKLIQEKERSVLQLQEELKAVRTKLRVAESGGGGAGGGNKMRRPTKAHNGQTQAPRLLHAPSELQLLQPRLQQSPSGQQQMPGMPGFPARNNMMMTPPHMNNMTPPHNNMTPPPSNNYGPRSAPSAIAGGAGSAPTLEQRMQALQQRTNSSFTVNDVEPCFFFRRMLNVSRTTAVCYTNLNKFCAYALIFERFRWRRRYGTDATTQCRVWQGSRFSWWSARPVVTCHVYMTV